MPVTAISAGLAIGKAVMGGIQQHKANKALRELQNQPMAQYSVSPELQGAYNQAQQMSSIGYTRGEQAAYLSNLQQANNAQYSNAKNAAGSSLAGAIGAGIQSQNIGALNNFAMNDAALHRQNIDRANNIASQIQQVNNLEIGANRDYRVMQEQAFGTAAAQGRQNMYGGIGELGLAGQAFALGGGFNSPQSMEYNPTYNTPTTSAPYVQQSDAYNSAQPFYPTMSGGVNQGGFYPTSTGR